MAWVKRAKGGLWSDIMTTKVENPLNPLKRKQANIPTRNPLPAFPAWQEWNLWATLRDCYTAKPVPQRAQPARQYKSTNLLPSWFEQLVNSDFKCPERDTALEYR